MIKRLIFDLDNTLIMWKDEYNDVVKFALEKIGYHGNTKELSDQINELIGEFEARLIKHYDRNELLKFINNKLDLELPIEFMEELIKNNDLAAPDKLDKEIYEILEYLYQKYDLVILSTWFKEAQRRRMEKVGILKYFKEIYGEKNVKPHREAFIDAMGVYKPFECAMVGDSLDLDIRPAKNAGIEKVVWKDNFNKKDEYENNLDGIDIITNLKELKDIF